MATKKTKNQLIAGLQKEGFIFQEFSLCHEGQYSVADADWNYKDIPHMRYVHELADAIPSYIDDDKIASVVVQKIPGFKIPLSVFIYENSPTSQLYYTSSFFFILIIESTYESIGPNKTRVTTTYATGTSKIFRWTFPILRWLIKRNYNNLMSTDIPMRERRGQLRDWGYELYNPLPTYSYIKSVDITKINVIPPQKGPIENRESLNIHSIFSEKAEYYWGTDDAWGLRLIKTDQHVKVFSRMCHHEGASLDGQACKDGKIQCPWHGRLFSPIAFFKLNQNEIQSATSRFHQIDFVDNEVQITLLNTSCNAEPCEMIS